MGIYGDGENVIVKPKNEKSFDIKVGANSAFHYCLVQWSKFMATSLQYPEKDANVHKVLYLKT